VNERYKAIGFFDSGIGGLSVLKEAIKLLPNEDFIYFGDSINAPYGTRQIDEVKELTFKAVDFLISKNVKAVVIACNTATSAAIDDLRMKYSPMPIIGIEPAVKPAVELKKAGRILIMATPMTLAETKFSNLLKSYETEADIVPVPCAGLAEIVEGGQLTGDVVNSYLKDKLAAYINEPISSVVLGCTHYPFIKAELVKILNEDTTIIDGSLGTAKQLQRKLASCKLLNEATHNGSVTVINSLNSEDIITLSYKLLT
jgi:glutamate racemase